MQIWWKMSLKIHIIWNSLLWFSLIHLSYMMHLSLQRMLGHGWAMSGKRSNSTNNTGIFNEQSMQLFKPDSKSLKRFCWSNYLQKYFLVVLFNFFSFPCAVTQQTNGFDCSVFVCIYGYALYQNRLTPVTFVDLHMEKPPLKTSISGSTFFSLTLFRWSS